MSFLSAYPRCSTLARPSCLDAWCSSLAGLANSDTTGHAPELVASTFDYRRGARGVSVFNLVGVSMRAYLRLFQSWYSSAMEPCGQSPSRVALTPTLRQCMELRMVFRSLYRPGPGQPMRLRILDARIAGTQPLQKVPFWDGLVMASFIDQPPCADWIWPPSAPQKEIHV